MTLEQATTRELEIEQVKRRIAEVDAEIQRITCDVLPGMIQKQARRRKELERQETLARCSNAQAQRPGLTAGVERKETKGKPHE